MMKIKRGDAYCVPVQIMLNDVALAAGDVELVEFRAGDVRKLYPGEVTYGDSTFFVPLTQKDTFKFPPDGYVAFDVRAKMHGGTVLGTQRMAFFVTPDALSEEVI